MVFDNIFNILLIAGLGTIAVIIILRSIIVIAIYLNPADRVTPFFYCYIIFIILSNNFAFFSNLIYSLDFILNDRVSYFKNIEIDSYYILIIYSAISIAITYIFLPFLFFLYQYKDNDDIRFVL